MPDWPAQHRPESARQRATVWIVHRRAERRAALARLVGRGTDVIAGSPSEGFFDAADAAQVVVLSPSGDFEHELEFAHRFSRKLEGCGWVLVPDAADTAEARRLFDALPAELLSYPPSPRKLARAIARALHGRRAASVARRRGRDQLGARFGRWFTNLEVPDLLRALDPQLAGLPLLVRGERGTGRGLIARYVHTLGRSREGAFLSVDCAGASSARDLLDQLEGVRVGSDVRCAIALEHVDALPLSLQHRIQVWLEFGLPEELMIAPNIRWIATADDESALPLDEEPALADGLIQILAGVELRIPPLREQPGAVEPFVADTTAAWCAANGQAARSFSAEAHAVLREYPWPGNLRELEAVVVRTLSATKDDPILPGHLRFEGGLGADTSLETGGGERGPEEPEASDKPAPEPGAEAAEPVVVAELEPGEEGAAAAASPGAAPEVVDPAASAGAEPASSPAPASSPEPATGAGPSAYARDSRPVIEVMPVRQTAAEPAPAPAGSFDLASLRRLIAAIAHDVRNPLTTIRTFASLLPESYDDAEFRQRFAMRVADGVQRIESVMERLQDLSDLPDGATGQFDTADLLERLLDARRGDIQSRRLLVLKEFDRNHPQALGDEASLHHAIDGLLMRALSLVPPRGDVYIASHHHPAGLRGSPSVRILLRYNTPRTRQIAGDSDAPRVEGASAVENAIEFLVAEWVVRSQGGTLVIDTTDSHESVIVIDLPAPAPQPASR